MKIAESAKSVDLDEVAHNIFWKFADENFVVCFLVVEELTYLMTVLQCWCTYNYV